MRDSRTSIALVVLAVLLVGGCTRDGASSTPDGTIAASVQALRDDDLVRLVSITSTKEQRQEMETQWDQQRSKPASPTEKAQFQQTMAMLTGPDAEAQLMAMLEPRLEELEPQLGMMTGMFGMMAAGALQNQQGLSPEERQKAQEVVEALAKFVNEADVTNREKAEQAIAAVCRGARKLEVKTMDQVQTLSLDEMLTKGGVVLGTVKEVLSIYGLSLDEVLDSVQVKTLQQEGDTAKVQVSFELLGIEHDMEAEMHKVNGRWIGAQAQSPPDAGQR